MGRLLSYTAIALVFGALADTVGLQSFSGNTSLIIGISLVMGAAIYLMVEWFLPKSWSRLLLQLSAVVGKTQGAKRIFFFGAINGLLPCGMVWMAASLAVGASNFMTVVLVMSVFLLGTSPALLGVQFLQAFISRKLNFIKLKATTSRITFPVFVFTVGLLLVVRGVHHLESIKSGEGANIPNMECRP